MTEGKAHMGRCCGETLRVMTTGRKKCNRCGKVYSRKGALVGSRKYHFGRTRDIA